MGGDLITSHVVGGIRVINILVMVLMLWGDYYTLYNIIIILLLYNGGVILSLRWHNVM